MSGSKAFLHFLSPAKTLKSPLNCEQKVLLRAVEPHIIWKKRKESWDPVWRHQMWIKEEWCTETCGSSSNQQRDGRHVGVFRLLFSATQWWEIFIVFGWQRDITHPFYLMEPLVVCICAELKLPVPAAGSSCVLEGKWTETELLVAWLPVLGDIIGSSHWTTNSRSFYRGWWFRLPLHHHSNAPCVYFF